jgi:hypothetical protein
MHRRLLASSSARILGSPYLLEHFSLHLQSFNSRLRYPTLHSDSIMSDQDIEKPGVLDHVERTATEDSNDARINIFSEAEQKAIIRRIDRRLVTTLGLLYCASLMDRTNLGSAAIAG